MVQDIFKMALAKTLGHLIKFLCLGLFIFVVVYLIMDYTTSDAVRKYAQAAKAMQKVTNASTKESFKQEYVENTRRINEIFKSSNSVEEDKQEEQDVVETKPLFQWPTADLHTITSPFGYRVHPITGVKNSMHTGVDISGNSAMSKPITSAAKGVVESVKRSNTGYGNHLVINHQNGYKTLYAHCSEILVQQGQEVDQGELIAKVGSTGNSTGPHLHFEIIMNNERVNPMDYFD